MILLSYFATFRENLQTKCYNFSIDHKNYGDSYIMRGFFGVGVEGITKPYNAGAIFRTANAFGASFVFTVGADYRGKKGKRVDTSATHKSIPFYEFADWQQVILPKNTKIVGVELTDDAIELPSFKHPNNAVYILGPERGNLSQETIEMCDHIVKIPTKFCLNVSLAGGIILYDRAISQTRFPARPVSEEGKIEDLPPHVQGGAVIRSNLQSATEFQQLPFDHNINNHNKDNK